MELVEEAYRAGDKKLSLPAKSLDAMASRTTAMDIEVAATRARELATNDQELAVPIRLLVAIEGAATDRGRFRQQLLRIVEGVLRQHPAFDDDATRLALTQPPEDRDAAVAAVATAATVLAAQGSFVDKGGRTKAKAALRTNVVTSMVLFLAVRDRWSASDVTLALSRYAWPAATSRSTKQAERLSMLADARHRDVAVIVARSFQERLRDGSHAIEELNTSIRDLDAQIAAQGSALAEVDRRLARLQAERDELAHALAAAQTSISDERQQRVFDRSHHVDEYEALRSRITRMLRTHAAMLSDALHALRDARTAVTEEYLERVIDDIRHESTRSMTDDGKRGR
jgi:hypothetical protein